MSQIQTNVVPKQPRLREAPLSRGLQSDARLKPNLRGTEGKMDGRTARVSHPDRKISETFLHFAAPMLHDLPSKAPEHRAREALQVAFSAWNAVVFADVLNDYRYLDEVRRLVADKPETALLVDQLIARKRAFFGDDERLIGSWEVTRTRDGINLRADARDPHTVPRDPV